MSIIIDIFQHILGALMGIVGVAVILAVNLAIAFFIFWVFTGWAPWFL